MGSYLGTLLLGFNAAGLCYTTWYLVRVGAGYTLALWLKIETACSQPVAIVSTEPSKFSLVYQSDTLQLRFHMAEWAWLLTAEGVVIGRWHHVTVTWTSMAGISLYIDAILANRCA